MLMRLVLSAHLSSTTSLPWTHAAISWELDNVLMPSPRIWPQIRRLRFRAGRELVGGTWLASSRTWV